MLLDAAGRLFIDKGVDAVGLDEIAAEAGATRVELARHFDGKQALLAALRERFVETFCTHLRQAMARCRADDWSGRLRAWVAAGFDGYLDNVALHDVVFHGVDTHDRELQRRNPVVDQLTELLQGGVDARAWVTSDPRMTAIVFFNALHAAVDHLVAVGAPYERMRAMRILTGYFERSVQWWKQV
ncbi:TetR/AcrR family transcriptional regulator [Luteimonas sp. R10]|uniref:TetR/AcrR family transcriptional regulator n=1 Tax=Luteimonas sp. R10 TaxID=3108176 RepID=UPI003091BB56|nr:helix-turn-helix domain-containing protein [Luteimonas sp. R10]